MKLSRFLAVACVALLFAGRAHAQPGFGRVANQPWEGGVTAINEMRAPKGPSDKVKVGTVFTGRGGQLPGNSQLNVTVPRVVSVNLRELIKSQWRQQRQLMIDSALKFLDEKDIGGGFRTSRNRLQVPEDGPIFVGADAGGFTIRFSIPNNVLSTYLRTPTPLDRDLDPGFLVGFDLDIVIDVDVKNNQLVASPARILPTVRPPAGKNVTGALAVAAADLLKTLSGADFVGVFLKQVNGEAFNVQTSLNRELERLNPLLRTASNGGVIIAGFNGNTGSVTLTLRNAGPATVVH